MALHQHYLGPNNVDHMAAAAEKELQTNRYNGESRNYTLEAHILTHLKAHTILEGLKEFGYTGIDERSKVRHFVDSIKTKAFDSVKTQIMSNPAMRQDFDSCTNVHYSRTSSLRTRSMDPSDRSQHLEVSRN